MRLASQVGIGAVAVALIAAYSYSSGRDAERDRANKAQQKEDARIADSIAKIRRERDAAVVRQLHADSLLNRALDSLNRSIERSHRAVTIIDASHATIAAHDSTPAHVVELPAEIVQRMVDDSVAIKRLQSALVQKDVTIDSLKALRVTDADELAARKKQITDLSKPPIKPPFLDRVIARVAVPVVKATALAALGFGGIKLVRSLVH